MMLYILDQDSLGQARASASWSPDSECDAAWPTRTRTQAARGQSEQWGNIELQSRESLHI